MPGKNHPRVRIAEKPRGEGPKAHPEGRRCAECNTKLNRYNKEDLCSLCKQRFHPQGRPPLTGGQASKL